MNKDSDSECRSQIIIQKKCYSLYINKAVDEKIQQADAWMLPYVLEGNVTSHIDGDVN